MGTNSAHPFENPTYWTNAVETSAIFLLPVAMVFAFGFYTDRKKLSYIIISIMTIGTLVLLVPAISAELSGNPILAKIGVDISQGNLEGKEVRIGSSNSALWAIITTVTSSGSVNSMMDSMMPVTVTNALIAMMVNAFYGGVGVGFLNFYIFIIIAVFISGLMIGRTPEFLGKKIEAKEIKIAIFVALLHPFLILTGDAIAVFIQVTHNMSWLNNGGFRGFTEMLYEFTSSAANNGSGMEGLGDNSLFWNVSTGIVMILGRYIPIIGPVAIAGLLAQKKTIPESAGSLRTDTPTFGIMVMAVIVIVAALAFFPALALGPIAESLIK